jgi:hypothetical protein
MPVFSKLTDIMLNDCSKVVGQDVANYPKRHSVNF